MKIYAQLWSLSELFLEREIFRTEVLEKIKTYILWSVFFLPENLTVCEIMWRNTVEPAGHRWLYNMANALCMLYN